MFGKVEFIYFNMNFLNIFNGCMDLNLILNFVLSFVGRVKGYFLFVLESLKLLC